ncbi:MAG: hypothetical protein GX614_11805 [Sandaracinaceae bacterium]|nr:hypothetical protein [Sandaracinaceae bacterium]
MYRFSLATLAIALLLGFSQEASAQSKAPEGLWVAGGFNFMARNGAIPGMRAEVGFRVAPKVPLDLVIPVTIGGRWGTQILTIAPAVQYEYRFENLPKGVLSIVGEGGLGIGFLFRNDTDVAGILRILAGARYYFEKVDGLFVHLTPLGFTAFMRRGGWAAYDFTMGAGFRFK